MRRIMARRRPWRDDRDDDSLVAHLYTWIWKMIRLPVIHTFTTQTCDHNRIPVNNNLYYAKWVNNSRPNL